MSRIAAVVVMQPVTAEGARRLPVRRCLHDHDPGVPLLRVDDLGVTRGDGVFESISVIDGSPVDLPGHLARLRRCAELLDLPPLSTEVIEAAVLRAVDRCSGQPGLSVRVVVTRGPESFGEPTAWVAAAPAADLSRQRRDGVRAVLLDRGMRADAGASAPWLLAGVKTLSYAIHAAATREARRRGAEEAVFVSTDGYVLEATTASVLARFGDRAVSPSQDQDILPGTTVARAADVLASAGVALEHRPLPAAELPDCDGLWLLSSGRRAVPVIELDGRPLPLDRDLTDLLVRGLGRVGPAASEAARGHGPAR